MAVQTDVATGAITVNQTAYAETILKRFGMTACTSVTTPMDTGHALSVSPTGSTLLRDDEASVYRSMIGALMFLAVCTRPDIAFTVSNLACYMAAPTDVHTVAAKRLLRYIRGTTALGLTYGGPSAKGGVNTLVGYADASYNSDPDNSRSVGAYVFMLNGAAVSWRSKRQATVALSTTEAEYMALCSAVQEAVYLRSILSSLGAPQASTVIFEDNQPTIHVATNAVTTPRTKHIAVKYHYVREQVLAHTVKLEYIGTDEMVADALSKALPRPTLSKFQRVMLGTLT